MNIKLKQFSNTEQYFIATEWKADDSGGDNGYRESHFDLPLNNDLLLKAEMCRYYYGDLNNEQRNRAKTPEMTVEEAIPYLYANKAINEAVKSFERRVWYPFLQKQIRASKCKGMKGSLNNIDILCYSMCGRTMLTLTRNDKIVTLITVEDEDPYGPYRQTILSGHEISMGPMGYQSIYASANEACDMIFDLIANRDKINLENDEKVGLVF